MSNFPKDFLWGASTSSHQVEGNNHNDWSEWEKVNAERLAKESESKFGQLSSWPYIKEEAQRSESYISGIACDHYNRFREDFDIAQQLGHNAHRFSIEWSRIEPEEGKFNNEEIEHYREVIKALRDRGLEPFVTLWHWTLPLWMRDKWGVISKEFPIFFERYVRYTVGKLKEEVTFWMTLNEPASVIGAAYKSGAWPPQKKSIVLALRAFRVLADAHCRAYRAIHAINHNAQVGCGPGLWYVEPQRAGYLLDRFAASFCRFFANHYFFRLTGTEVHDYIGVQQYRYFKVMFPHTMRSPAAPVSDMGWELIPEGTFKILMEMKRYNKPMYITEHGLADGDDSRRAWFITETLKNIKKAMEAGADVRGYLHWSLLDNFEWDKGFWPRFGLVAVDRKTLERKIRPSALEYKKIIEGD